MTGAAPIPAGSPLPPKKTGRKNPASLQPLKLHPTPPSHLLSPTLLSSPSFHNIYSRTYTAYELRYRFYPTKILPLHSQFSFHVFLGPIPDDVCSDAWFNTPSRIGVHGISSSHYSSSGGGGGGGKGVVGGVVPLTRVLLERLRSLDVGVVLPYLREELRWVAETDDGGAIDPELLPMFEVKVASAEISVGEGEEKEPEWVFYESVVELKGRLK